MYRTAAAEGFSSLREHDLDLLEASCDWAFITDTQCVIRYCHKCRSATYDILPQNLVGKPFEVFLPPKAREAVMHQMRPDTLPHGKCVETIYTDPMAGIYSLKATLVEKEGTFSGYNITIRHISQEAIGFIRRELYGNSARTISEHASVQLEQQRLIATLSAEFAKTSDIDYLLPATIKTLGQFMQVDRCSVFKHDTEHKTYSVLHEWCAPGCSSTKDLLQNIPYNEEDEGFIQLTTRPYIAVDDTFMYSGDAYRVQRESGVHAFVDLPLVVDGTFWGFLGADYGSGPHYWTDSEFHMLQTISVIMAAAIQKKEMEDRLHDAYSKLSEIVHNYPGVIWAVDKDNVITLFEGRVFEDLHLKKEALVGLPINCSKIKNATGDALDRHNATFTEGDQSFFTEFKGRHFTCETTLLHTLDGEASGVVGVALDITDMRHMQQRLEIAIHDAEQASQAKTDFLSRMSHEIRTPMNAIIGMNEIARKSGNPERIAYCLDKIEQASQQLLGLINDILDIAKIEANKLEISVAEFDFEKMLQSVYNVVQSKVEAKHLEFTFGLRSSLDRTLVSDELRLTQVITNLLSNAVKFTPENGKISLNAQILNVGGKSALLRVDVRDTGIGVSPEDQKKLFKTFEQADGSITRRFGGTGLGLSICKKIMELMGGSIWIESVPGSGSCFTFEVPVTLGAPCTALRNELPAGREMRILVVDDSEEERVYCRDLIEGFGMHCATAPEGFSAVEHVRRAAAENENYDVIFVDWKMPGMNGIETTRAIRAICPAETVVIMISVADWADIREQAQGVGITSFLPKPFLPSALFNAIVACTGRATVKELSASHKTTYDWRGKTVLVAEDIEINQEILCSLLEPTGIAVQCTANGREALEKFSTRPDLYDLILMDLQMPEMDGYEATRRIRGSKCPGADTVPILAMTANAFVEDVKKCLACGMNGHVSKPLNADELMRTLDACLFPSASA